MGLLDDFSTLSDSAKQYALNKLAQFGNGVGNTVQQIPGNAQRIAQGLLSLPHEVSHTFSTQPGGLFDPQGYNQLAAVLKNPPKANPGQWMDQGMALAGMAPVGGLIGMTKGADGLLGVADNVPMPSDYGMSHRPPMRDSGAPLHDLTGGGTVYPDDIYSPNAALYYGHYGSNHPMDRETMSIIQSMRGNPNGDVTIYRAVPSTLTNEGKIATLEKQMAAYLKRGNLPEGVTDKGWYDKAYDELASLKSAPPTPPEKTPTINPGDWVTINPKYAKEHGESTLEGQYKILKKKVKAKDIFTNGDSIHEFGYDPQNK